MIVARLLVIVSVGLCAIACAQRQSADGRKTGEFSRDQQLVMACFRLEPERVKQLLHEGANINARFGGDPRVFESKWTGGYAMASAEWTPLLALADSETYPDPDEQIDFTTEDWTEQRERLEKKIPAGAQEKRDERRLKIARVLLEGKADLNLDDGHGATALYDAIENNRERLALMLMEAGAGVNTRTTTYIDDAGGYTPLLSAIDRNMLTVVRALIAKGADVNAADNDGKTALHHALHRPEMVELLIKAGARVDVKDKEGKTPLAAAEEGRYVTGLFGGVDGQAHSLFDDAPARGGKEDPDVVRTIGILKKAGARQEHGAPSIR